MSSAEIAERIEAELKKKGVKKSVFYEECGISRASFSQWRHNLHYPTKEALDKINEFLGLTFSVTVGETEKTSATEDGRELPHAEAREVLSEGGMRLLLDADAKMPEEHLEEIVEFIRMKQRKYGR